MECRRRDLSCELRGYFGIYRASGAEMRSDRARCPSPGGSKTVEIRRSDLQDRGDDGRPNGSERRRAILWSSIDGHATRIVWGDLAWSFGAVRRYRDASKTTSATPGMWQVWMWSPSPITTTGAWSPWLSIRSSWSEIRRQVEGFYRPWGVRHPARLRMDELDPRASTCPVLRLRGRGPELGGSRFRIAGISCGTHCAESLPDRGPSFGRWPDSDQLAVPS